ncbi:DUF3618 domain-containing protein [Corynebacterium guangdongense]|uniref:Chromate transport protein ChrA n=1 Tax=Corynebacterium guangdongense TaxID=1783348 RepID=A0ABU1ZYY8_9CORY|nr:DUF3618 domain-containing protein [Corynebacterium guangdongense]MDR7330154.1 chromate transport protein ChrA [Corynebacterium guangdongense]WJZ18712.1 hypothetical protein CGUA_10820 [Corynebacterium guangdongense]
MARNIDDIQRDIERTRAQLAGTLDELAHRTKPATLVEDAKTGVSNKLQDPTVQKVIAGVAAAVIGVVGLTVARNRRKANDIKEIQKLLAERSWA